MRPFASWPSATVPARVALNVAGRPLEGVVLVAAVRTVLCFSSDAGVPAFAAQPGAPGPLANQIAPSSVAASAPPAAPSRSDGSTREPASRTAIETSTTPTETAASAWSQPARGSLPVPSEWKRARGQHA